MRRESLAEKKQQKGFYKRWFHFAVNLLIVSMVSNLLLVGVIQNRIKHMPPERFYAKNNVSAPVLLTPLDAPNESSQPLLPDDPIEEMKIRDLPENMVEESE